MSTPDANGWLPIETAPTNGSEVLGFWSYIYPGDSAETTGIQVIRWERHKFGATTSSGWRDDEGLANPNVYTHWQPLPAPPTPPDLMDGGPVL